MFSIDEKKLTPKLITEDIIRRLAFGGCSPFNETLLHKIVGRYFIFYSVMTVILEIVNFLINNNKSIYNLIDEVIMIFGFMQVAAKFSTAILGRRIIAKMLHTLWYEFWNIDTLNEKEKRVALAQYKLANTMSKMYGFVVLSAGILIAIQTRFKERPSFINEIWIPHREILNTTLYYEILYSLQSVCLLVIAVGCVIPLDQLFINLFFFVSVQFQMIREEMKLLNNKVQDNASNIIRRIVNHHNTVYKFLINYDAVFSPLLLINVAVNYFTITITMLGIVYEESINRRITNVFVYLAMTGQIFAYCLAGQIMQDEGTSLAEAAYKIDWFMLKDVKIQKDIMLIIQRSQRKFQLTAGGIMIMNMESFASVLKTTFSFLAFIVNTGK